MDANISSHVTKRVIQIRREMVEAGISASYPNEWLDAKLLVAISINDFAGVMAISYILLRLKNKSEKKSVE